MNLAGRWSFQLDPGDVGVVEGWFHRSLTSQIELPGSLQAQGFGDEVAVDTPWVGGIVDRSWFTDDRYARYREPGNIKVPFWLQPETYYAGAAWYQREFEAPAEWPGQRVTLTLERPHWETRVWLDGQELGRRDSLSTPHVYELGTSVAPGRHTLTIRVDNRMIVEVGPNAHSVSDHTQTNWNGIVGRVELHVGSPVWLADVQVYPQVAERAARVIVQIGNTARVAGTAQLTLSARLTNTHGEHAPAPVSVAVPLNADGGAAEVIYPLGVDARLWDEFTPALYRLDLALEAEAAGRRYTDEQTATFGLREVRVQGTQIAVNGRPIFLRGTLECCIFPHTGYPPTDLDAWKRIIRICRAHGLNHIRFHSWCPPEAAFVAGDQEGFYYQVECASWANQGTTIGDGRPLDAWLYEEAARITRAYANHPSFLLMAYGNEPGGEHHPEYLAKWVDYWKANETRCLHTSGAGWPAIPENEYHNIPQPRIQAWDEELKSRINAQPPETRTDYRAYVERLGKAIVSHEIGQWCAHPNLAEVDKYTGVLKAKNLEIFRDLLEENHMGDQAHDFLIASGKLQTLCYKEEIESALRTPGFAGFQLLDLHDFPGQGTALVGVLDAFWDSKGYVTPQQFHRFCADTVPLARLEKRYWRVSETLSADLDLAHYGPTGLEGVTATWRLLDAGGAPVASGDLAPADVPTGGLMRLGTIQIPLGALVPAAKYTLVVEVPLVGAANDWDVWLFADMIEATVPPDVQIVEQLDASALALLAAGAKVLLLANPAKLKIDSQIGFSSVFWNTAWTKRNTWTKPGSNDQKGQAPHTLGVVCDPAHPVFAAFPTEAHSNWQWWELVYGAAAMTLDAMPPALRPLVQPIDTWFDAHRLGLLFEARVGGGRLMVCSMDLTTDLEQRLVARQLRHSLLAYMAGEAFDPQLEVGVNKVQALWA